MSPAIVAYIGLGSNLDNPVNHITGALARLAEVRASSLETHSRLYRNPPMGPQDQPEYVNAVAAIRTCLSALDLLHEMQTIEREHGRIRGAERWGPRTLDLDLLLYGRESIDERGLTVPHPGIAERPFVLVPLAEIAPRLDLPVYGPIENLIAAVDRRSVVALDEVNDETRSAGRC